jgi:hypothetical protein
MRKTRKPVNYVASTIYVTPSQHDYLRRRAYEEKRTAAEIIRELVAREMEVAHMEQISRNIYGAIHDWYMQYRETEDTRSGFSFSPTCDIYYDPDTQDVRAVSSVADYPGIRVLDNVQASDFLTDDDPATYTKDEFIDACMAAHGNVEIPEESV